MSFAKPPRTKSIAALLCPHVHVALLNEVESFRIAWEREHGPTDITRYYTSLWPEDQADALCAIDPQTYFQGLPPFLQSYIAADTSKLADRGRIDDVADPFRTLFLRGRLRPLPTSTHR